jgi:hypothetical protein
MWGGVTPADGCDADMPRAKRDGILDSLHHRIQQRDDLQFARDGYPAPSGVAQHAMTAGNTGHLEPSAL